ncbi:hypothetical protein M2132_001847 [Dysgonomonas sp. PH5-45]|uniref:DUF3836 domain-containing protein n=1 Tax=unclassified Dysgonomonas TaxID=2630389 RepID=UPI002475FE6A|nr:MULTISPECIES: DUF3836 domain-containing protein [unclassified Dysgonomonas]MDH6355502.1 hypothetical protein [Dysgonomonas sp. PH5-45]MDH6388437.1 hypothetical protein [Dysgonomonas sp. PH5-37]
MTRFINRENPLTPKESIHPFKKHTYNYDESGKVVGRSVYSWNPFKYKWELKAEYGITKQELSNATVSQTTKTNSTLQANNNK